MIEQINTSYNVTFTLEEIKPLAITYIPDAQNISNWDCLQKCRQYDMWHSPLIKFYEKNKKMKPTMGDKLAFVILLSYPIHVIKKLSDISDIKLFAHDNTDFIYKQELTLNKEENESERYDCICSYQKLQNVHYVENKYSGITLQVGSECIKKYNLISQEELKKFKKTEKLLNEKKKEIKEGKALGHYQVEKQRKKEEKMILQLEKENIQKQEKIKTGNFKICINCGINIVDIRRQCLCICNKCKNNNDHKELACNQIKKYGLNECQNCDNKFIDIKQYPYLCKGCKPQNKIIKCSMHLCPTLMVVDINEQISIYCDDCEKIIIKCIDCNHKFIQNVSETTSRCKSCQYNYKNKFINKICVSCNEEMTIKETELWRKYCNDCYIEIKDTLKNPPKCKCGLVMLEKTIKKDGINKGRKGLGCSKFPNGCNDFKML
jgi:hypothetical protein